MGPSHTRALALVGLLVTSCGGQRSSAPSFDIDGACKTAPAVAATRVASPGEPSTCSDPAAYQALADRCNQTRDPAACYQSASCVGAQRLLLEEDDPRRGEHEASMLAGYTVACEGKIAEGCVNRAALAEELLEQEPGRSDAAALRAHVCTGYRTACELGVDFDGCSRCLAAGCSGQPGADQGQPGAGAP